MSDDTSPVAAFAWSTQGMIDLLEFDLKSFEMPKVSLDSMKLPDMPELFDIQEMPKIDIPKMPQIDLPNLPNVGVPALPDFDMAKFLGIDPQSIGGSSDGIVSPVVAVVLVGLVAALIASANSGTTGGGESSAARKSVRKPRKASSNLSVPYDASARLAYDAWCMANNEVFNEGGYEHFREIFSAKAVADATAKKLGRDLAMFKNKAPTPPPRNISSRPPAASTINGDSALFFAKQKS